MNQINVVRTIGDLRKWRAVQRQLGNPVGLVPTMGALHEGHLGLLKQSLTENKASVVSIFVNPSQFAPHEDLGRYPRTFEDDLAKIQRVLGTAPSAPLAVFAPTVEEMYPAGISLDRSQQVGTFIEVLGFSHQLEGSIRPHFFRGVATVVNKLLNAVQPDVAYFGQKDMQQSAVVRRMVRDLLMPVNIVIGETAREPSGLAMSSRNAYLSKEVRQKAAVVFDALTKAQAAFTAGETRSKALVDIVREVIATEPVISDIEYISVNDLDTLAPLETATVGSTISMAVGLPNAAGARTRILDNIVLK